jgi:hypothetical protein
MMNIHNTKLLKRSVMIILRLNQKDQDQKVVLGIDILREENKKFTNQLIDMKSHKVEAEIETIEEIEKVIVIKEMIEDTTREEEMTRDMVDQVVVEVINKIDTVNMMINMVDIVVMIEKELQMTIEDEMTVLHVA